MPPIDVLDGDPGSFGGGGEPIVTPKDSENKDGTTLTSGKTLPPGAAKGGSVVSGGRLGRGTSK